MKKSIRKPRKAGFYLILAGILFVFGAAAVYLSLWAENDEYAEEAACYADLAEQVHQDHIDLHIASPKEDVNTAVETTSPHCEVVSTGDDGVPDTAPERPPDQSVKHEENRNPVVYPDPTATSTKDTQAVIQQDLPTTTSDFDEKAPDRTANRENGKTDKQPDSPMPSPSPSPSTGYTGADLNACQARNPDFIAWLKIPGTNINYPVVLSDNTDFYLTHSFDGKKSKLGTLFSLGKTDYQTPGRNISIYGHHITNTSSGELMFRPLLSYKQRSFYEKHSIIYMDSLYHSATYRIFAVVNLVKGEWDPSTASFASDADFMAFIRQAQTRSLYDTGVEVTTSDHILTLITCDRSYAAADGRLIVLAVEQ